MFSAYNITQYKQIVDILYEEHKKHTAQWLEDIEKNPYNLKKLQVRDVCSSNPENIDGFIKEDFLSYVDNYKSGLGLLYLKVVYKVYKEVGLTLGGRIKNDDSILLKLHRKRFEDEGRFPLNKYLNDLLGFRIIDSNYENNKKYLFSYVEALKSQKQRLRHKFRENGSYKGYHIYFMGNNNYAFPMELQIWDISNEKINLTSHEMYKKDYTYWPKIYNEG